MSTAIRPSSTPAGEPSAEAGAPGTSRKESAMQLRPSVALTAAAAIALVAAVALSRPAAAHCDTLDGPVVTDARAALAAGDPTLVLKWVSAADEPEIRAAFERTLAVRKLGGEAATLADTWFFENLVRVHRAGEGAPYTGLAPAGSVEPGIAAADRAIAAGSSDELVAEISAHARAGVTERFERLRAAKAHAAHDLEAGRAWVAAYVDYIHYVEGLHVAIEREAGHAHGAAAEPAAGAHRH